MKLARFSLIAHITVLLLMGCGFAHQEEVVQHHYLIATDLGEQMSLCFHLPEDQNNYGTIIPATVYSVGYDDKYIISKQHPCNEAVCPDKSKTYYYILPIKEKMDWSTKNGLIGPMDESAFSAMCKELGIENLPFTTTIESLE